MEKTRKLSNVKKPQTNGKNLKNQEAVSAVNRQSLTNEMVTRQTSNNWFGGWFALENLFPNPDPVLKKMGKTVEAYSEVLNDTHLYGDVKARKSGTLSLEWDIEQGKSSATERKEIRKYFYDLPVKDLTNQIIDAQLFGYQIFELIWKNETKYWLPAMIEKPREWFHFDNNNQLRFKSKTNKLEGELCPPEKFIIATHEATYNNPYGVPLLSKCYWNTFFRKNTLKFWATFTEKYGMPWFLAQYMQSMDTDVVEDFMEDLIKMVQDGVILYPEWLKESKFETPGMRLSSEIYDSLRERCAAENSVVILGHTASSTATPGRLGQEQAAEKAKEYVINEDKRLVEETFNVLIKRIHQFNFSGSEMPYFKFYEETDIKKDLAERDKVLTELGVVFNPEYIEDTYNIDQEYFTMGKPAIASTEAEPQMSERNIIQLKEKGGKLIKKSLNNLKKIDKFKEHLQNSKEYEDIKEAMLEPIFELIENGKDYKEMLNDLYKLYPDLPTEDLEDFLMRMMHTADMAGFNLAESEKE